MTVLHLNRRGCLEIESVTMHCIRTRHALSRHRPRKRAIQYSETSMMESKGRSVPDTPFVGYARRVLGDTFRCPDGATRDPRTFYGSPPRELR